MFYHIINSGSKGNCVVIEDVMVDCGAPYGDIKEYLKPVKFLLLTHIHSDHINRQTLEMIKQHRPDIDILGNTQVHHHFGVDHVVSPNFPLRIAGREFQPFRLKHDVENTGFVWFVDKKIVLFATDTSDLDNAPHLAYDYMFIESSYDEEKLKRANEWAKELDRKPFTKFGTHLSKQEAHAFFNIAKRNNKSVLVELHQSPMFY